MTKYYPPSNKSEQFHCIHCGVFSKQVWGKLYFESYLNHYRENKESPILYCACQHCDLISYWYQEKMIVPAEAPVEPPHADMPTSVINEYQEARSIFARSPRAAAALLRLAIQKLMVELGESGNNINTDIGSLVAKGLPVEVQQAFDFCRVVGNNAVHPGEINLNDTPEMGQQLFSLINFIVEDRITRPRKIEALYNQLPDKARAAIKKRDT